MESPLRRADEILHNGFESARQFRDMSSQPTSRCRFLRFVGPASVGVSSGCLGGNDCDSLPESEPVSIEKLPEGFAEIIGDSEEYQRELFEYTNDEFREREVLGEPLVEEPLYDADSVENEFYEDRSVPGGSSGGTDVLVSRVEIHSSNPLASVGEYTDTEEARIYYAVGLEILATGILSNGVRKYRDSENRELYEVFEDAITEIECRLEGDDGYGMWAVLPREDVEHFFGEYGRTELSDTREQSDVGKELFGYMREHSGCYRTEGSGIF